MSPTVTTSANTIRPQTANIYQQLSGAVTGMIYGSPAYFNGVL